MRITISAHQLQSLAQSNISPNHSKANDTSKAPPTRRLMRSHTRDAAQNAPIEGAESSVVKTTSKGKNNGLEVKRKVDDAKLDKPDAPDATKNEFGSKRAKKIEVKQSTYINPFLSEPSLPVAQHEAHSHALTQTPHTALSNDSSTDGQSFFS
jgi:hypothetical protein